MAASILAGLLLFTASASAECTRDFLIGATDKYVAAQANGAAADVVALATPNVTYTENEVPTDITKGILTESIKIDHNRSIHDTVNCATFTELIAATNPHQYVIGTRILFDSNNKISLIESIVTDKGDWAFNATGYLYWDSLENWDPIPEDKRDSREVIQAAGNAYFERFKNESVVVPFGIPCSRLEGGASTAPLNMTGDSCTLAGLPSTLVVTNRRFVVDEVMGVVDIFLGFPGLDRSQGNKTMPDSHVFRVESGKIKYIHTVSSCVEAGCGMNGTIPMSRRVRRIRTFDQPRPVWH
ncbi:uncharacterized protein F4822DRAFT_433901 [Hypoxylon trugodes]|uniref:uncharacterized protein n=1 Tax=Hypoxylon trugodes TaxID=326681 RepID=UPI00219433F5|nr:uncharacterized protein F4822DRAFT_433901 [Hypoxylon trugodes]KAI1383949.1 hypothetical protein F4822DRAFT_433901 [Hypoxylon trugodes]